VVAEWMNLKTAFVQEFSQTISLLTLLGMVSWLFGSTSHIPILPLVMGIVFIMG